MPGFGKQSYVDPLSDQDIADVSNYVLTKFGNPDAHVSPADVAAARAGGPVPLLAKVQPFMLPAALLGLVAAMTVAGYIVTRSRARLTH